MSNERKPDSEYPVDLSELDEPFKPEPTRDRRNTLKLEPIKLERLLLACK